MAGYSFRILCVVATVLAMTAAFQNCSLDSPSPENGANFASALPPEFTFSKTPSPVSASTTSTFEFAAELNGATFTCSLNNQAFATCASPYTLSNLPDASYILVVRASNGGATYDQTYTWIVDRTAPTVVISTSIGFTNQRNQSIAFSTANQGPTVTSFQCKLDAAAFVACNSPFSITNLAQGSHTVQVKGTDAAANVSAAATLTFVVDLAAPTVFFNGGFPYGDGANYTCGYSDTAISLVFAGADTGGSGVKTFTCKYDGGAETVCTSPQNRTVLLADINYPYVTHTMIIKVTDQAGNVGSATRTFQIVYSDCTPPPDPGGGGP